MFIGYQFINDVHMIIRITAIHTVIVYYLLFSIRTRSNLTKGCYYWTLLTQTNWSNVCELQVLYFQSLECTWLMQLYAFLKF